MLLSLLKVPETGENRVIYQCFDGSPSHIVLRPLKASDASPRPRFVVHIDPRDLETLETRYQTGKRPYTARFSGCGFLKVETLDAETLDPSQSLTVNTGGKTRDIITDACNIWVVEKTLIIE